jgi:hypothetical protein
MEVGKSEENDMLRSPPDTPSAHTIFSPGDHFPFAPDTPFSHMLHHIKD